MSKVVEDLVIEIRDHYVAQFRAFALVNRASCSAGGPEMKFQLPPDTNAFRQIAVVDFVRNEGVLEATLFEPDKVLTFERIEGRIAETELVIEALRWDAVVISHDSPSIEEAIAHWFEKWFDPDETNFDPTAELSGCIHAVFLAPGELQIDLGTAPAEAFWELLESVSGGDATRICITS